MIKTILYVERHCGIHDELHSSCRIKTIRRNKPIERFTMYAMPNTEFGKVDRKTWKSRVYYQNYH